MRAFIALLAAWLSTLASGNVIGIDMGVDYMKVALVAPRRPLEIVTNTASKRKTEMAICFDRGERSFGSDAYVLLQRKPKSSFVKLTTLLGRGPDHPAVIALQDSGVPCDMFYNETRGGYSVRVEDAGAESTYFVEELVAMMLGHAQLITKMFGATVKDVVLAVPEFFTVHERRALLDAAELANLSVLTLIDENTAAAVQLAIDRTYDEDHTVLFYNMGANSVQVTVATFGPKMDKGKNVGQVTVRGKAWDATLGGGSFDLRLADLIAESFNKKWGKGDVRKFERPMAKIRARANKVKEVLSANTAIPVTLEALHDDVDFTTSVTRAQFEEKCADLFPRLTAPIDAALAAAGMTMKDVHSVEVLGGGVRVPKVQETLKEYLAKESGGGAAPDLGVHLNGDEAMALGAAFRGANISRAFAVRQVGVTDLTPFAVDMSLRDAAVVAAEGGQGVLGGLFGGGKKDSKDKDKAAGAAEEEPNFKRHNLYAAGAALPQKKTFTITHAKDLEVNLTYAAPGEENPQLPEGTQLLINTYTVTGIAKFAKEMEAAGHGTTKVALRFTADNNAVPVLSFAEAFVEYEKEVTYEELVDDPDAIAAAADASSDSTATTSDDAAAAAADSSSEGTDEAGSSSSDGDSGDSKDEKSEAAAAAEDESSESKSGKDNSSSSKGSEKKAKGKGKAAKDKKPAPKKKMVTRTRTVIDKKKQKLTVTETLEASGAAVVRPLSLAEKAAAKAQLSALDAADEARRLRNEAKNGLEAYILRVRSELDDREKEMAAVSTEEQREAVLSLSRELEDWLYDEGWNEDAATYKKRRAELAGLAEAIFLRASEVKERPAAVEQARASLAKVVEMVEKWKVQKPQITEAEREEVLSKVKAAQDWLDAKEKEQAAKKPHEEPAFVSTDIDPHMRTVRALVGKMSKKPAPPPPKPAPKADNSSSSDNSTTSSAGEEAGAAADDAAAAAAAEGGKDAADGNGEPGAAEEGGRKAPAAEEDSASGGEAGLDDAAEGAKDEL